jgi:hypothetical protein
MGVAFIKRIDQLCQYHLNLTLTPPTLAGPIELVMVSIILVLALVAAASVACSQLTRLCAIDCIHSKMLDGYYRLLILIPGLLC